MLSVLPLTLGYDGKPVLRFAGMELERGEHCLLTGPSGSGKTTLLYAIAGLIGVMEGGIAINNVEISALPQRERDVFRGEHMGIIFQTLHLVRSISVLENVLLPSYITGRRQNKKQARELLAKLGIGDKADKLPEALSQGQAQRVAIARAVLHKPTLILADEPTSSLDDTSCENVISLIKNMAEESGATLLISTIDSRVKAHFSKVVKL